MEIFKYDKIFTNLTKPWELVYSKGLLDIKIIEDMEEPFKTLCNKYLDMVQNSSSREVIKIMMEMDISDYILKTKNDTYIVQGILIIKELIISMLANNYMALIDLAKVFCTENTFIKLTPIFTKIERKQIY